MATKFFTNSAERTVFQKFKGILENMKDVHSFLSVVGYFRSSGYFALQPYLRNIKEIKILVGINVDEMFSNAQKKGLVYFGDEQKTKDEFLNWFLQDLREAKYTEEVEKGILDFVDDLVTGRIEVRAHNSKTLHAKFYLFLPEKHTEHSDGWVIMGSSNLTEAGLGIRKTPNYELNIALKDFDDVEFTKEQFKLLWHESTSILPSDIEEYKSKTHIGQTFTPFEIYLKLLIEYFGNNIDYDPDTVGDLPKNFKKLSYQIDAVNQGFKMLMDHNGFFLADVVGLGKTIVASMIAKRFLIANGSVNTKILVVYPPTLEKTWKNAFRIFNIDKHTKFISNGSLDNIIEGKDLNYWPKEDYDLIIVDEAHKYRNHTSQSFNFLQRICKSPRRGTGLIEGSNKKVILISATPLNNRPQDLYYQLLLFQDSRNSTLPIANLQTFFGPIIRRYREQMREEKPNISEIRELYNTIRDKIISQITVRRTRRDLKNYPKYLTDLKEQGIAFPEIAPLKPVEYQLNSNLGSLFYHTVLYLTQEDKVNYYRYQTIRFLKSDIREIYYDQAILVSKSLAGIMKTLMVKRLESSFYAFKITLNNLLISTTRMIEMFNKDKVFIAPDLNINDLIEKGFLIEDIERLVFELSIDNPQNNIFKASDFEPEYLEGLIRDKELLQELCESWKEVDEDPKLEKLLVALKSELFDRSKNPTGLLVIFTESNDTANYLAEKLRGFNNKNVLKISSANRKQIFETIQENFDANYIGTHKNDYEILVTTDVLAEGVNLHRANVMVNYDTPWNATRLMQRIGRINRIGSVSGVIYNYIFYPSQHGDEEIKLYKNALIKLQGFHSTFGEDTQVFTHEELIEQFELFKEGTTDDEDKRLFYLRFIREFKETNPKEYKRIKNFPLKARTARKSPSVGRSLDKCQTLVFLKSPYKIEFYRTTSESVLPLTFLEAAQLFEARPDETAFSIPAKHYEQVQLALNEFEKEALDASLETVSSLEKSDAITSQAKKFLRECKAITKNKSVQNVCTQLIKLVDNGTFTALPNEVRKIKRKLDNKTLFFPQVENILLTLSNTYNFERESASPNATDRPVVLQVSPEIVISATII